MGRRLRRQRNMSTCIVVSWRRQVLHLPAAQARRLQRLFLRRVSVTLGTMGRPYSSPATFPNKAMMDEKTEIELATMR